MRQEYTIEQLARLPQTDWHMIIPVAGNTSGLSVKVDRQEVITRALAQEKKENHKLLAAATPLSVGDTESLIIFSFTTLPR